VDDLLKEVAREGARVLGESLAGAPAAVVARAMAAAGPPFDDLIALTLAEPVPADRREVARRWVGEVAARPDARARDLLCRLGLRALRDSFGTEGARGLACLAGRLPAAYGRHLLEP
jgi:hypothetical protein